MQNRDRRGLERQGRSLDRSGEIRSEDGIDGVVPTSIAEPSGLVSVRSSRQPAGGQASLVVMVLE